MSASPTRPRVGLAITFFLLLTGRVCAQESLHNPVPMNELEAEQIFSKVMNLNPTLVYPEPELYMSEPNFFAFSLWHRSEKFGSGNGGYYAVNKFTGELWEIKFACKKVENEESKKLEVTLKKRQGNAYSRYALLKPDICE